MKTKNIQIQFDRSPRMTNIDRAHRTNEMTQITKKHHNLTNSVPIVGKMVTQSLDALKDKPLNIEK